MEFQQYNFEIIYRSGKDNKNVDILLWLKFEKENIKRTENNQEYKIVMMEKNKKNKNQIQKNKHVKMR